MLNSVPKSTLNTNNPNNSYSTAVSTSGCFLRRKKDPPQSPSKPPPTLPKPKFILPQSSATQLVLQRNLKAKSELNIATPPPCSSSSAVCSSSSSTSSCSSTNQDLIGQKPSQTLTNNNNSNINNSNSNNNPQLPIRNKLLENSSLVSSSAGYHSDTWESSHSSRQSFDEPNNQLPPQQQHQHYRKVEISLK